MAVYRAEVRAVAQGGLDAVDLASAVVGAGAGQGLEVDVVDTFTTAGILGVAVRFNATSDEVAQRFVAALPASVPHLSVEADRLRTGRGRAHRRL